VVDPLKMALARRRPGPGLIHHSDQGGQHVSLAFGRAARDAGITLSMGSRGDAYDNAVAETFFATLKKELVNRRSWPSWSTDSKARRQPTSNLHRAAPASEDGRREAFEPTRRAASFLGSGATAAATFGLPRETGSQIPELRC
jgi:transposase InsO family protein